MDGSLSHPLRFGAITLPNEPWPTLVQRWQRLESAGLDSIWACDHFTNPHRPGQPWFEGWTALAALAMATTRVRLGLLVSAIVSRPPTLLAKHAQTVDHASNGRLEVGIGAGGAPTDQPMWGVEEWSPRERADRFAEYIELVDTLLRTSGATYRGKWYSTAGAEMAPGFVQQPRPPLTLAAHGPTTLATAARFADTWNTLGPSLDEAKANAAELARCCQRLGRDPATIRHAVLMGLADGTAWTNPAEFAQVVETWAAAGFSEFVFYDPPYARAGVPVAAPEMVDVVLAETIPMLRQQFVMPA